MLKVQNLKVEHLKTPMGIDAVNPRFSWTIKSLTPNTKQSKYQIIAFTSDNEALWDSGEISSDQTQNVCWRGPVLLTGQRIHWFVKVWTATEFAISPQTWFEMGVMEPEFWKAKWIEPEGTVDIEARKPSPYLRKIFHVKKGLKKARIYQSSKGLYEFWMNGSIVTQDIFKPGFTSYHKRLQYQCYDITPFLNEGTNCWAVVLGDGWYRGITGGMLTNNFGYKLAFRGQIFLLYDDRTSDIVVTDESFLTATGGLIASDMKMGDIYDASLEHKEWKLPSFDDSTWHSVNPAGNNATALIASRSVPIREKEHLYAKLLITPNGESVLDFGQNIAGYVSVTLNNLKKGQKVVLVHGETLDTFGNFTLDNLLLGGAPGEDPFQTVIFYSSGKPIENYCPKFSIFGFRYVLIKGLEIPVDPANFTAIAVYSDMAETGQFTCSNSLLNKLFMNSKWSMKGNFMDVMTDCPTRERGAWGGDAQVFCRTACYLMDTYSFYEKWMLDMSAEQCQNGNVGNTFPATNSSHNEPERRRILADASKNLITQVTADCLTDPVIGGKRDGSAGWGDCATIIPYTLYLLYGDKKILHNQYDSAKKWVDFSIARAKQKNPHYYYKSYYTDVNSSDYVCDVGYHFGEWYEADNGTGGVINEDGTLVGDLTERLSNYPDYLVATAYLGYSSLLLSKMAHILEKAEDATYYESFYKMVKSVYNNYFIQKDGTIAPGRQASNVRTLAFDLCFEENIPNVSKKLNDYITANRYHLNTGFLSTPYILKVLAENGYISTAYHLLEQEDSPSWLSSVKAGATTIMESWDSFEEKKDSFNHCSYGAVSSFMFEYILGIQPLLESPGFSRFIIKPYIGGSLTFANGTYNSIHGTIGVFWKKIGDRIDYCLKIPANTAAKIMLPASEKNLKKITLSYNDAVFNNGRIIFNLGSGEWNISTTNATL